PGSRLAIAFPSVNAGLLEVAGKPGLVEVLPRRMPDLVIGARRSTFPRPWRAGVIAVALLGVAVIVAWFIYRRSVAYDMPGGEVHGEITFATPQGAPGARPVLVYGSASLEWAGGLAVLRASGDAHAIGAAHGRLLGPLLRPVVEAARPSIE